MSNTSKIIKSYEPDKESNLEQNNSIQKLNSIQSVPKTEKVNATHSENNINLSRINLSINKSIHNSEYIKICPTIENNNNKIITPGEDKSIQFNNSKEDNWEDLIRENFNNINFQSPYQRKILNTSISMFKENPTSSNADDEYLNCEINHVCNTLYKTLGTLRYL